ncbi:hypothetical protein E3G43_002337 [Mycobacteroides abscessus]|nr:hypothetical protein E3G43_002337 [Mycobacteroides abscessus]
MVSVRARAFIAAARLQRKKSFYGHRGGNASPLECASERRPLRAATVGAAPSPNHPP